MRTGARRCRGTAVPPRRRPRRARRRCAASAWPRRSRRRGDRSAGSGPVPTGRSRSPPGVVVQIPVGGQNGAQLTPGVEDCLVDRASAGTESRDQGVQRHPVQNDRDEDLTLSRGQLLLNGGADRGDQVVPFGTLGGLAAEPVRQPFPVLRVEADVRGAPEMPSELGGYLKDDELVRPGGKPAL